MPEENKGMGIESIVNGAVGALGQIGSWMGIGEGRQDRRQIAQQQKLQDMSIKGSKEMTDYNRQSQMQTWEDTNYAAQVEQAKKAGLSVSYLMGKGGSGGGSIAPSGMSVGMGQAASGAAGQAAAAQTAMTAAQIANLNADTEKKKVEAGKIGGADTANVIASTNWQNIQNEIAGKTSEDAINIIHDKARQQYAEASIAQGQHGIMEGTQKAQIEKIQAEATGAILQNEATRQGIALDQAKINQIANDIVMRTKEMEVNKEGQAISERNMERMVDGMLMGAGINAASNVVKGIIDLRKGKGETTRETINYDQQGRESSSTSREKRR